VTVPATRIEQAAWLLAGIFLFLVIELHLLPALLAGLLVFELVHILSPHLGRHLSSHRAKLVAVLFLAVLVIGSVVAGTVLAIGFFNGNGGGLTELAQKMADTIENARQWLPDWLLAWLPASLDNMKDAAAHWLREHAGEVGVLGKEAGIGFAHVLVGMVIGAMAALQEAGASTQMRPLAAALAERAVRLAESFRRIVFAQVRISLLNTAFTTIYLVVLLPLSGAHLPLTKTMIALTFVAGLLPVIGNLISNTVIVVVSLAQSPQVALASLVFLIVIHKLEYFLNARIVGSQISAKAWELLLAMLVLEAAFGLPGVVAAPIYYAYLKDELAARELV
jgi:predicted PurR-regulated permease PerM